MTAHRPIRRFAAAALIAAVAAAAPDAAPAQPADPRPPSVTVAGEATAASAPDLAVIQAGVSAQGKTAREAMLGGGRLLTAVLSALKDSGIAESDIQTSRLRLNPIRDPNRSGVAPIIAVESTTLITVQVRDVSKAADTLDRMVSAGANIVTGIGFTLSDASKLLDKAREEAFADARRKAEIYARAAGLKLGPALSIAEGYVVRPMARNLAAREAAMPIAAGEEQLQMSVNVSFELLR